MYILNFLGNLADPNNHEKVAKLEQFRREYARVVEYLNKKLDRGETLYFSDFVDGASERLEINNGAVGEIMWDILMSQYAITVDAHFKINRTRSITVPNIGKWDASALAVM